MYLLSSDFRAIAAFVDWLGDSTAELCICFSTVHIVGSFYLNFLRSLTSLSISAKMLWQRATHFISTMIGSRGHQIQAVAPANHPVWYSFWPTPPTWYIMCWFEVSLAHDTGAQSLPNTSKERDHPRHTSHNTQLPNLGTPWKFQTTKQRRRFMFHGWIMPSDVEFNKPAARPWPRPNM